MADYEDWIEQEELDMAENSPLKPTFEKRKSVVIVDFSKRKESMMAATAATPNEVPMAVINSINTNKDGSNKSDEVQDSARRPSESKVFPGLTIETRAEKIKKGKRVEQVQVEVKWPWALLGLGFMAGGITLTIFGGWCIQQNPTGNTLPAEGEFDACGPADVAGGISMLMCGVLIIMASVWQLISLRRHRRKLVATPL